MISVWRGWGRVGVGEGGGGRGMRVVSVVERRVRFPAVVALARTRVAPCATGVRQSRDCLHPLPLQRPRVLASATPFFSGNRPHFHLIRRALASRALVRAPSRSSHTVRSTAPRSSAYEITHMSGNAESCKCHRDVISCRCFPRGKHNRLPAWFTLRSVCAKEGRRQATVAAAVGSR